MTFAIAVKDAAHMLLDEAIIVAGGTERVKTLPSLSTGLDIYLGMDGVDCECELSLYIH